MKRKRQRRPPERIDDLATHQKPYVTLDALASYWGFTRQALVKWAHEGQLKAYRFGRALRVRTEDARAFEADARLSRRSA
jgi:excisionase family DNA binding protein